MIIAPLGWFGIVRLGLVQTALGAVVVLTTSTLNRIMVVELQLAAVFARAAGRAALRGADHPAALGLWFGMSADAALPGSWAAWRPSPPAVQVLRRRRR